MPAVVDASPWITWVVLPLLIFAARTADMTLSTLRIVFIAQGRTKLAPLIGFFESLLWLVVVGQTLKHLSNPACLFAYAGGFAAGNRLGLEVERRLAMGLRLLRVITQETPAGEMLDDLRGAGFGVTTVDGQGARGAVEIVFTVVRRRDVEGAIEIVRRHDPQAFVSVADVRQADAGVFPAPITRPFDRLRWSALRKTR